METTPGARLQAAIQESGMSQRRVALACGVAPQSITNAIRREKVSAQLAQAVAAITGHRWEWILTGQLPQRPSGDGWRAVSQVGRRLTVCSPTAITSWPLTGGVMFLDVDTELASQLGPAAYCLAIDDDSMRDNSADSVQRGDRVVMDPAITPGPGDLVLAFVPGQPHALFRRFRDRGRDANGRVLADLVPLNPDFATLTVAIGDDAAQVRGVMVEHRRTRRPPPA